MRSSPWAAAFGAIASFIATGPASADETPKHGGMLTYMIPADAPPSFDGHRETTYATVHPTAPFYSVLIRLDPEHPEDHAISSATSAPRCRSRPTTAPPIRSRSARA